MDHQCAGVAIRYMPAWNLEELQRARELAFPNLSPEIVKERYLVWGGVARCDTHSPAQSGHAHIDVRPPSVPDRYMSTHHMNAFHVIPDE
jgi:hypothetical protein